MKHNIYLNGQLYNIEFNDNWIEKSVWVLEPGNYTLTTEKNETIQCLTGELKINNNICIPWEKITINKWESFNISASVTSSYICIYS